MTFAARTRLGAYEIVAPLGAGGMGEVYRARDTRLDRDVAVKVLPADVSSHPDRLARFEREAKAVAALNHPNIVTLHSIEASEGVRFITMELVEGSSLDRLVAAGGMPTSRLLDLAIPLADALVAAHARGIVHRDLKPANVMVTREGRVKVLDFGLAKLTDDGAALDATQAATVAAPISAAGQVVGTVPYMAPEQLRGETVDARTDLFSVGVMLYELATGQRPFRGTSSAEISSAILRDVPAPVQQLRHDLPPDLARIIGRCLEKDPERRVQTAKDVRNELELLRRTAPSDTSAITATARPAPASPPSSTAAVSAVPSIAVLPFVNRSRDEEDEYFSDGLADELIGVLVKLRGLRVAARSSSGTFKGRNVTIAEAGRALNVATVLEGSVRKAGNRVRITVQLVKVEGEEPLWSETYDRTLEDIFAVQDDIAQSVVKELRTTLLGESQDSAASGAARAQVAEAARGRASDPEAHRLYLQGRYYLDRLNLEDGRKALESLERAAAIDPDNARVWVQIARFHHSSAAYGWGPIEEGVRRSREAVDRALALDPDAPDALVARARLQSTFDWDWDGAEASLRRALELAPQDAEVLRESATVARSRGDLERAVALLDRALALDPLSAATYGQMGGLQRALGNWEASERALQKGIDLAPSRIGMRLQLAITVGNQGRHEEAVAIARSEPAEWARLTALAVTLRDVGDVAGAEAALRVLEANYAQDSAYQIAAIHALAGRTDAAFHWLDRACDIRDAGVPTLRIEPAFRSLRTDPRWPQLLQRIGLG